MKSFFTVATLPAGTSPAFTIYLNPNKQAINALGSFINF